MVIESSFAVRGIQLQTSKVKDDPGLYEKEKERNKAKFG